jgi:hypothetical protein
MVPGTLNGVVILASFVASLQDPDVSSSTRNETGRRTARQPSELADLDAQAGVERRRGRCQHGRGEVDVLREEGDLPHRYAPRLSGVRKGTSARPHPGGWAFRRTIFFLPVIMRIADSIRLRSGVLSGIIRQESLVS